MNYTYHRCYAHYTYYVILYTISFRGNNVNMRKAKIHEDFLSLGDTKHMVSLLRQTRSWGKLWLQFGDTRRDIPGVYCIKTGIWSVLRKTEWHDMTSWIQHPFPFFINLQTLPVLTWPHGSPWIHMDPHGSRPWCCIFTKLCQALVSTDSTEMASSSRRSASSSSSSVWPWINIPAEGKPRERFDWLLPGESQSPVIYNIKCSSDQFG